MAGLGDQEVTTLEDRVMMQKHFPRAIETFDSEQERKKSTSEFIILYFEFLELARQLS